ncbi:major facilitator superfamily-domain-containing protein [Xylariales sp. PMI_506]|nr:major facilitator superfamily-domain-containing protein [Xylariales sp. PMI_506]
MSSPGSHKDGGSLSQTPSNTIIEDPIVGEKDDNVRDKSDELPSEDSVIYPQGIQLTLILLSVMLTLFLAALDQTIVATAIPRITDEFQGLDKVSWYGSAYFMTFAGFLPSWGKALRYFSIKYTFLASLFIFELGSLICGVAPSVNALIAGRAIAGLGCAGLGTGCFLALTLATEPQKRPLFMGSLVMVYGLASVCGPLIGGALTSNVSWRWCFYINLPVGGVSAVATFFSFNLPAKPVPATLKEKILQMDLGGALILMASIIMFILAFQYGGQTMPWRSSTVIGLLVGFGLSIPVFFIWESWQGERGVLVLRLFKRRAVWVSSMFQCFYAITYFVALYYLPIYFQSINGVSASQSGVRNLPLVLALGLMSPITGTIMSKSGHVIPIMVAGACLATIGCGLFYTFGENEAAGKWIGYQIIAGAAWGGAWSCSLMTAQAGQAIEDLPTINSIVLLFQTLGGAFGLAAAQSAFDNRMINTLASTAPGLDVSLVLNTGATELRSVFDSAELEGVLLAYLAGLKVVWIVTVAAGGAALLVSLMGKWDRLYQDSGGGF